MVIDLLFNLIAAGVFVLIAYVGIEANRLFYLFRRKYPKIAKKEIPYAFECWAEPEKFNFFFRKKNIEILKNDKEIWAIRQKIKTLLVLLLFSLSALLLFPVITFLIVKIFN